MVIVTILANIQEKLLHKSLLGYILLNLSREFMCVHVAYDKTRTIMH